MGASSFLFILLEVFLLPSMLECLYSCPAGSAVYKAGHLCYWELHQALAANDANSACATQGGSLAVFPDATTEQFVKDNLGIQTYTYSGCNDNLCDTWFLGYRDNDTDGVYTTWLGQPVSYMSSHISINGGSTESCIIVWRDTPTTLHWQDRSCSSPRKAICYRHYALPEIQTSGHWRAKYVGRLQGHVLHLVTVRSLVRCAHACQKDVYCVSFSFARERGRCQLNDVTPASYPGDVVNDADYKTYQLL